MLFGECLNSIGYMRLEVDPNRQQFRLTYAFVYCAFRLRPPAGARELLNELKHLELDQERARIIMQRGLAVGHTPTQLICM